MQTMGQLHIKMWTHLKCDVGVVGSYFHHRLVSLLRISPRYWGVMKRGWQERCKLPSCPSTFCIYLISTISGTLSSFYSGGEGTLTENGHFSTLTGGCVHCSTFWGAGYTVSHSGEVVHFNKFFEGGEGGGGAI